MGNVLRRIPYEAQKRSYEGKVLRGRVLRVIDGDTCICIVKLNWREPYYQISIRLAGIDTPEMKPARKDFSCEEDRLLHKRAAEHVKKLVEERLLPIGTLVKIDFDKDEKYGRQMGRIYVRRGFLCFGQWIDVNQILVDSGMALPYGGKEKLTFSNEMLKKILKIRTLCS